MLWLTLGTHVSFNSGFLGVYAQQWDCWVVWQFYFQFFKESPHCSPIVAVLECIPTNSVRGFPFLHTLSRIWEKALATHSSTLAWRIPWLEEPGRLQSMGSLRVRHDRATSLPLFTYMPWKRKWQPTPVFLPGESQGLGSLVGCIAQSMGSHRVGHD